uniref:Nrap protein domain-containing protein n=1 Tax=Arcella intermedia TaxID=1963864 RepID=A0A6B2LKK4_9EUKA
MHADVSIGTINVESLRSIMELMDSDKRIRPLLFSIKKWAKERNLNDAHAGKIKNFGWTVIGLVYFNCCKAEQQPLESSSLEQLLIGFFEFLLHFNWKEKRMNLRLGIVDKEPLKFDSETLVCVEDPSAPFVNMTFHVTPKTFPFLQKEWNRALHMLKQGTTLQSLFKS